MLPRKANFYLSWKMVRGRVVRIRSVRVMSWTPCCLYSLHRAAGDKKIGIMYCFSPCYMYTKIVAACCPIQMCMKCRSEQESVQWIKKMSDSPICNHDVCLCSCIYRWLHISACTSGSSGQCIVVLLNVWHNAMRNPLPKPAPVSGTLHTPGFFCTGMAWL